MNTVSLITHGLSSIAVFGDVVGTRILILTISCFVAALTALGTVLGIRLFTELTEPGSGYATYTAGLLVLFLFQSVFLGTIFSMIILSTRNAFHSIPIRDYTFFVDGIFPLFAKVPYTGAGNDAVSTDLADGTNVSSASTETDRHGSSVLR